MNIIEYVSWIFWPYLFFFLSHEDPPLVIQATILRFCHQLLYIYFFPFLQILCFQCRNDVFERLILKILLHYLFRSLSRYHSADGGPDCLRRNDELRTKCYPTYRCQTHLALYSIYFILLLYLIDFVYFFNELTVVIDLC